MHVHHVCLDCDKLNQRTNSRCKIPMLPWYMYRLWSRDKDGSQNIIYYTRPRPSNYILVYIQVMGYNLLIPIIS